MPAARPVILTCAITGSGHTPTMSPHLPYTVEDVVEQSIGAAQAGASVIHLHARDPRDGSPTADPEVLVLVEPTSAVDAHTEARIAARLREHRTGRTTVVTTTSPLVLERVDRVALVVDGRVVATGTHAELLATDPAYRAVVVRESQPDLQPADQPVEAGR